MCNLCVYVYDHDAYHVHARPPPCDQGGVAVAASLPLLDRVAHLAAYDPRCEVVVVVVQQHSNVHIVVLSQDLQPTPFMDVVVMEVGGRVCVCVCVCV